MRRDQFYANSPSSDLSTSDLEQLRQGNWEIDCPEMTLKRRSPDSPVTFSGAGYIKQSGSGHFVFKLYVDKKTEPFTEDDLEAGVIIPDNAYFDFEAFDHKGRCWNSERLLPDITWSATGIPMFEGTLGNILCEGELPIEVESSTLLFRVFDSLRIPYNERTIQTKSVAKGRHRSKHGSLNAWKFRCSGFDFLLVKEEDKLLTIHVSTKTGRLPQHFEERVIETLQFVLTNGAS